MTIKPIGNRAVIKLLKTKTTKSGIIISAEEKNEQTLGEVISIGTGYDSEDGNISKLGIKKGDKVLVGKYGGEELKDESDNETTYKIVSVKDIMAVIEN
jgi:chaperonin GroES